jgi:hypothetical protein
MAAAKGAGPPAANLAFSTDVTYCRTDCAASPRKTAFGLRQQERLVAVPGRRGFAATMGIDQRIFRRAPIDVCRSAKDWLIQDRPVASDPPSIHRN